MSSLLDTKTARKSRIEKKKKKKKKKKVKELHKGRLWFAWAGKSIDQKYLMPLL